MLSILGLNKVQLLEELWKEQKSRPINDKNDNLTVLFQLIQKDKKTMDELFDKDQAQKEIDNGFIQYYKGKLIKMDLSKDYVDSSEYDKLAGEGTAYSIIKNLKN